MQFRINISLCRFLLDSGKYQGKFGGAMVCILASPYDMFIIPDQKIHVFLKTKNSRLEKLHSCVNAQTSFPRLGDGTPSKEKFYKNYKEICAIFLHKFSFRLSTQFLNGTHEFPELVLSRVALLMDQSGSISVLQSAKARGSGDLWREKCTRAPWSFPFKLIRTSSFRPVRTDK